MLAAIMGPVLFTLIIGFINHPEWLLVPLGLIGAVLLIAFIYGATTAVKQKPFPGDQLDLPPASLTPPQPAMADAWLASGVSTQERYRVKLTNHLRLVQEALRELLVATDFYCAESEGQLSGEKIAAFRKLIQLVGQP